MGRTIHRADPETLSKDISGKTYIVTGANSWGWKQHASLSNRVGTLSWRVAGSLQGKKLLSLS